MDGKPLDVWFPRPVLGADGRADGTEALSAEALAAALGEDFAGLIGEDAVRRTRRIAVRTTIADLQRPIGDLYDAFLRLHLLSHRLARPNTVSFAGLLEVSDYEVAWTSLGPCRADDLTGATLRAQRAGLPFHVRGVFPLPPMLDYVRPSGVAIADASRVLLGAYLAPGVRVTPEGFCGFNAGALGPCMIEGRISAGVVVGAGCHIGGSASLMGAISGGGRQLVSLGERCLLGANSGVGVALGDDCIVEAGVYVTAGAPVRLADGGVVKALELSGRSGLLFRRNAQSGALEALENANRWRGLNPVLHRF